MGCRVQACKNPVRIDQPDNKSHTVGLPPRRVDEMAEDKLSTCMTLGARGDRNQNHEK